MISGPILSWQHCDMHRLRSIDPRIAAVDGLRGFAVVLVFCVHFFGTFVNEVYGFNFDEVAKITEMSPKVAIYYWLFYSHYGVYLFFCISGFVIARMLSRVSTIAGWRAFVIRRLLRIYPAFLISLAMAYALAAWLTGSASLDWHTMIANLLFLNGWFSLSIFAYNNVSWSLFFEFVFYLAFSFLSLISVNVGKGRWRGGGVALWLVFIALLSIFGFREWFLFIPFAVGALVGTISEAWMRSWVKRNSNDVTAVIVYFASTSIAALAVALPQRGNDGLSWPQTSAWWLVESSLVFALLMLRVAYGESILTRFFAWSPIAYFGRISFSFFLVHSLVIILVFNIYRIAFGALASQVGLGLGVLIFGLSVALAALMYRFIELPAMRLSSSRLSPATTEI